MSRVRVIAVVSVGILAVALLATTSRLSAGGPIAVGGTPAARELIQQEIAKLPENHLSEVKFTSPPLDEVLSGVPASADNWVEISARATSRRDALVADWQAALVLAGFSEAMSEPTASAFNTVDGAGVVISDSTGSSLDRNNFDLGPHAVGDDGAPSFADRAVAEASLHQELAKGASAARGRLVQATFIELPKLSVDLTLSVDDPASFVADSGSRLRALFSSAGGMSGRLVRVVDSAGNPVLYASFVQRLNSGSAWIAPQYERASDIYGAPLSPP